MSLLPQQLFWHCRARNFEEAERYHLFSCIECGCCSYVCPSKIPLVQSFQYGKFQIRTEEEDQRRAETAQIRIARKAVRVEQANREAAERRAAALAKAQAAKVAKAEKAEKEAKEAKAQPQGAEAPEAAEPSPDPSQD